MHLDTSSCELLGRDKASNLIIRYRLTETPTQPWTVAFNNKADLGILIESTLGSNYILVIIIAANFANVNIATLINNRIFAVDAELTSDQLKNQIILNKFIDGLIVVHDSLSYVALEGEQSNFEKYIDFRVGWLNISTGSPLFQSYVDQLNVQLSQA